MIKPTENILPKQMKTLTKEVEYRGYKYFIDIELNTCVSISGLKYFKEKICTVYIHFLEAGNFFRKDEVNEDDLVRHIIEREEYMKKFIDSKFEDPIIKELKNLGFK